LFSFVAGEQNNARSADGDSTASRTGDRPTPNVDDTPRSLSGEMKKEVNLPYECRLTTCRGTIGVP